MSADLKCETENLKNNCLGIFLFWWFVFFFAYLFCTQGQRLAGALLLLNDKWEFRVRWDPMVGNCIAAENLPGGGGRGEGRRGGGLTTVSIFVLVVIVHGFYK